MFKRKVKEEDPVNKFLQINKKTNIGIIVLFSIITLLCVVPIIFVLIISFSSEASINANGFKFIPDEWTLYAYKYIFKEGGSLIMAFANSITITVVGTLFGLIMTTSFAYVLSRKEYKLQKFLTYTMLVTMLFNGGMVSRYMLITRVLDWKNTLLALIIPSAVTAFNIVILRTFIKTSVPNEVIESARIDGASELKTFLAIVLPITVPGIATIGLFLALNFWNQWMPSMLYTDKESLYTLQYLLMQIERNVQYISQNADTLGAGFLDSVANMPTESSKMAIVVISTLPIACAYPFFQKYFISGLTIGAVKG
ncbi:MAG: carbohydrate ABC transporter permease [Lachnospirales bacterium]